jgi:hypothetical protein
MEQEAEPDREYRYCRAIEIVLPKLIEDHDPFIDGLEGLNNEEDA